MFELYDLYEHFPKEYPNYLIYWYHVQFVPLQMEPNSEPKLRLLPDWYRWISRCRPWVGMDWQIHPGLHRVRSWSLDMWNKNAGLSNDEENKKSRHHRHHISAICKVSQSHKEVLVVKEPTKQCVDQVQPMAPTANVDASKIASHRPATNEENSISPKSSLGHAVCCYAKSVPQSF